MSATYLTLFCESYRNNLITGFTRLQRKQEFVDLTLAADGHLVKVHKNIIALASPYLKEMLQSASTQNPVIFLNNVDHNVLEYLLDYIYLGEVSVPQDTFESFLQVCESLHITGINKIIPPKPNQNAEKTSITQPKVQTPLIKLDATCDDSERQNNFAARITIKSDHNFELHQFDGKQDSNLDPSYDTNKKNEDQQITYAETFQDNMPIIENFIDAINPKTNYVDGVDNSQTNDMDIDISLIQEQQPSTITEKKHTKLHSPIQIPSHNSKENLSLIQTQQPTITEKEPANLHPTIQILSNSKENSETPLLDLTQPIKLDKEATDALKIIAQYSVTERGAVQIIVSRYIYCSHHNSKGGRKHRWRCSDYRKLRCPAYIDSWDHRIVLRKGIHNHAYHDNKIYKKHKEGLIFHSIEEAKNASINQNKNSYVKDDDALIEFSAIPVNEEAKEARKPHTKLYAEVDDIENAIEFSSISMKKAIDSRKLNKQLYAEVDDVEKAIELSSIPVNEEAKIDRNAYKKTLAEFDDVNENEIEFSSIPVKKAKDYRKRNKKLYAEVDDVEKAIEFSAIPVNEEARHDRKLYKESFAKFDNVKNAIEFSSIPVKEAKDSRKPGNIFYDDDDIENAIEFNAISTNAT